MLAASRTSSAVVLLVVALDQLAVQGLRQLRAVAVEGVGLQGQPPAQHVGVLAVLDGGVVRHVDGLRDRPGDERLRRRHHADVALDREIALAGAAAGIGAIEHRIMLELQVRRALQGHGAAGENVGGLDLGLGEAERGEQVEARRLIALGGDFQVAAQRLGAERPLVEDEADVERAPERRLDFVDRRLGHALLAQRGVVDARRIGERRAADGVGDHVLDRGFAVAERPQGVGHGAVDDLEIAAAGELLELDQREIGLDAGRVAVHHEADRAGRRDDRHLRVAVAVPLAEAQRRAPGGPRGVAQEARRPGRPWRARRGRAGSGRPTGSRSRKPRRRRRACGCG